MVLLSEKGLLMAAGDPKRSIWVNVANYRCSALADCGDFLKRRSVQHSWMYASKIIERTQTAQSLRPHYYHIYWHAHLWGGLVLLPSFSGIAEGVGRDGGPQQNCPTILRHSG